MNVWSRQQNYFIIDGEEAQAEVTLRYAILNNWTVSGAIPYLSQAGGNMDSTIQKFHSATGVTQGERNNYSQNKMNVSYEPYGQYYGILDNNPLKTLLRQYDTRTYPRTEQDPPISIEQIGRSNFKDYILLQHPELRYNDKTEIIALHSRDRIGSGNPRLFTEWEVYRGKMIDRVKVGFQYRFPVRDSFLLSSPGYDRSLFMVTQKDISQNTSLKLGISHTWYGEIYYLNFKLPKTRWTFRTSFEYKLNKNWTLFQEYVVTESPFRNFGKLGKPTHQVVFGSKYISDYGYLTFGFAEDIINYAASPDIGVFASFEGKL
jgi:hypothetical protein